jgi:hypothetical protein
MKAFARDVTTRLPYAGAADFQEWAVEHGYGTLVPGHSGVSGYKLLRLHDGVSDDDVRFHFFTGQRAPAKKFTEGDALAQWEYPKAAGRTRGEQLETARRITGFTDCGVGVDQMTLADIAA